MLFTGEVEEVIQSLRRGMEVAGGDLTDQFVIPNIEMSVYNALRGVFGDVSLDAIGVIETATVASTIVAADVAVKTAVVTPVEIRLANQLGGKAFVTLVGEVGDVRAGVAAGAAAAADRGHLVGEVVIAGPNPAIAKYLRAR
jgi:microcompartment protein CcmL/EutN